MKKKMVYIILTGLTTFSLAACSSTSGSSTAASADSMSSEEGADMTSMADDGMTSMSEEDMAMYEMSDMEVSSEEELSESAPASSSAITTADLPDSVDLSELPLIGAGETAKDKSLYTDSEGKSAVIPKDFTVSDKSGEQTISTGLVVCGPDGSEFVWVPTTDTELAIRDFGSYFYADGSIKGYGDETDLPEYQAMEKSTELYGGFYMGRYEASKGDNGAPASKPVTEDEPGQIWVQFAPQDTQGACEKIYADNDTVQGFFPWGANYDTTLQWIIDSGDKTEYEVTLDSTEWGNYSNDSFSVDARGAYTGAWEETKACNIYDLAGDNWEWTHERYGSGNYVMRGGGYNLMGGSCPGDVYPAALRNNLPGNNHHPNVTFRVGLYIE